MITQSCIVCTVSSNPLGYLSVYDKVARVTQILSSREVVNSSCIIGCTEHACKLCFVRDSSRYIDWTPFFITWSLAGKYPAILQDETVGEAARDLFSDAQEMLNEIIEQKLLKAKAVIGFWPANRSGDNDVDLFGNDGDKLPIETLHFWRQQIQKETVR